MAIHYVDGECSYVELPPSAIDKLNKKINNVSNRVSNITPYEESKQAYIGDTETTFVKAKEGMINASVITESGLSVPITLEITDSEIVVKYEPLDEVATVKLSIQ